MGLQTIEYLGQEESATADGKRVVFNQCTARSSVYVGAIERNGARISNPSGLTLSEGWNVPAWTPDSKAVFFASNRSGSKHFGIYRQALNAQTAESIVTGPEDVSAPRITPDGKWLLYDISSPGNTSEDRIMRMPVPGGPPEPVLTANINHLSCAKLATSVCVLGERYKDGKHFTFSELDPFKGRGKDLVKIDTDPTTGYNRDISPDGSRVAGVQRDLDGRIILVSLAGQAA